MFYRSQRLLLRPHWPEDWPAIYAGINDEGVVRNLARAPWPYREEDAQDFAKLPQIRRSPRFAITLAGSGELIGCIGLDPKEHGDSALELGYWIARKAWGQGYACEAGGAMINIAMMLGARRLEAGHYVDNPASGRVLQKLGFVRQAETVMRYSLGRNADVETVEYALELEGRLSSESAAA